jgi:beta-fructofuranosidase
MYTGSGFSDWEIGDITIIIHQGVYHLFHLIIPNHDYIAHAVSTDGISWKRVNNALFVGHPGQWDDDMLWTMHVYKDKENFKMYYTGLQRKDRGIISRVGLATSDNLMDWEKITGGYFPIEPKGIYYETSSSNPRTWLSFRDPFRFDYNGEVYLVIGARTVAGPVSRRGCVGLVKLNEDRAQLMPPLFCPLVYDDVECPCVFKLHGRFYLLGSIREDIKVRYWFAPDFLGEYHSFHADVLLPQGNYAARTEQDGEHLLIYHFFYAGKIDTLRVLPPPKQLDTDKDGRLVLRTYYRWEQMVTRIITQKDFSQPVCLLSNTTGTFAINPNNWICGARSGYELFCFDKPSSSFIWEGVLTLEGMGKFGIVTDMDNDGYGYFISFNVPNGVVQIRSWGFNPGNTRQNFIFHDLQSGFFSPAGDKAQIHFSLTRYGHYIEFAIDGIVRLTLVDYTHSGGKIGLYSASSLLSLQQSVIKILPDPIEEYGSQEEAQTSE